MRRQEMFRLSRDPKARVERNLHCKLNNFFMTENSHYCIPGYNLHRHQPENDEILDVERAKELCKNFPYSCDHPKPLLPPAPFTRLVLSGEDPALQLLLMKVQTQCDIDRILDYYKKNRYSVSLPLQKDFKWKNKKTSCSNVPKYLAEMAEILEADPDPYFEGTYNWYYTGGTLRNIVLDESNILLFPFTSNLVATFVEPRKKSIWKPKLRNASKCSYNGTLYDLKHTIVSDTCFVMGRFKNNCVLYRLLGMKENLDIVEIEKQASNIPYTSVDLHPQNPNLFCTADADRTVTLWDSTKNSEIMGGTVISNSKNYDNNWTSIKFQPSDNNVLLYTDRCCVHYLDTRLSMEDPVLTLCPKDNLEECEKISLVFGSRNDNCQYVGTYHSLLLVDKRMEECVQQKWTHNFKSAPIMGDVVNRDETEVITLSSQLSGENTVILNSWTLEDHGHSSSLPYRPPSILDTLSMSQTMGKCLDPLLERRLRLCNTGSTLLSDKYGNIYLFTQNSLGDVFYQSITHQEEMTPNSVENCRACRALELWEQAMLEQRVMKQTITHVCDTEKVDLQHIFEQLSDTTLKPQVEEQEIYGIPSWQKSMEELNSCKDLLGPGLLAMWEISKDLEVPLSAAPHQKVMNWLEKSEVGPENNVTQSSSFAEDGIDPLSQFSQVNTQELFSVSQQPLLYAEERLFSQQNQSQMSARAKSNRNKRKKTQALPGW